jgi:hypothetical protein
MADAKSFGNTLKRLATRHQTWQSAAIGKSTDQKSAAAIDRL